jgi:hypothetical protein
MKRADKQHVWGIEDIHTEVWSGNLRARDHLEELDRCRWEILKYILKKSTGPGGRGESGLDFVA